MENICSRLTNLKSLCRGNHTIMKEIDCLEGELTQIKEDYESKVVGLESKVAVLELKVADLESKVAGLESKVADHELQIKQLQSENAEHREKESKIALGQVALLFERSLAMFVLPENVANKYGELDAESFMYDWLSKNETSDEGQKRVRLHNSALSLHNREVLKKAKKKIKIIRNSIAHPSKVDFDEARLEVKKYLPTMAVECLNIINTVEKVHSLMKLGRLAREFQNGVYKFVFNEKGNTDIQAIQKTVEGNKEMEPYQYQRWMHLKGEIDWNKDHDDALAEIQNLKRTERPDICPLQDVTLDTAKKYVVDFVPKHQYGNVLNLINLIKELNSLQLGQLAMNFQDAFARYVVPDNKWKNVREVEDWLEREKDTQQGQKAIERWNKIAKSITWTEDHHEALDKMEELKGKYDIRPDINVNTAKLYYIDFLEEKSLWKPGLNILEMYERLQKVQLHD